MPQPRHEDRVRGRRNVELVGDGGAARGGGTPSSQAREGRRGQGRPTEPAPRGERRRLPPPRCRALSCPPSAARLSRGLFHAMAPSVRTYVAKPDDPERNWMLVDAEGKTLGRLATQIADILRGKRKPAYTPHIDTGDFVVVVNAEKIHVSGNKRQDKRYYRHSGYPGGLRSRTFEEMLARRPEEILRLAVKGMLPRNRLARKQLTKLKVYAGPEHPHTAQQPQPMEIDS